MDDDLLDLARVVVERDPVDPPDALTVLAHHWLAELDLHLVFLSVTAPG